MHREVSHDHFSNREIDTHTRRPSGLRFPCPYRIRETGRKCARRAAVQPFYSLGESKKKKNRKTPKEEFKCVLVVIIFTCRHSLTRNSNANQSAHDSMLKTVIRGSLVAKSIKVAERNYGKPNGYMQKKFEQKKNGNKSGQEIGVIWFLIMGFCFCRNHFLILTLFLSMNRGVTGDSAHSSMASILYPPVGPITSHAWIISIKSFSFRFNQSQSQRIRKRLSFPVLV